MGELSNEERFNKIFNDSKNLILEIMAQKNGEKEPNYDAIINLVKNVQKNQLNLFELLRKAEDINHQNEEITLEIPSFISRH